MPIALINMHTEATTAETNLLEDVPTTTKSSPKNDRYLGSAHFIMYEAMHNIQSQQAPS